MPSAASTLLRAGARALRASHGESVTFRGDPLTVTIDRDPFRRAVKTPDFNPRDLSVIRVDADDVDTIPAAGDIFIDEEGLVHRIQTVHRRGGDFDCECKVTAPPATLTDGGGNPLLTGSGAALLTGKP